MSFQLIPNPNLIKVKLHQAVRRDQHIIMYHQIPIKMLLMPGGEHLYSPSKSLIGAPPIMVLPNGGKNWML
jgi:hypothetical protein